MTRAFSGLPDFLLPDKQPTLKTKRLVLRPFVLTDGAAVAALAGDRAVAENTLSLPHPYTQADAETWIGQRPAAWATGKAMNFAIVLPDDNLPDGNLPNDMLCGSVGLNLYPAYNMAELGYWIGRPFWGRGYATEAAAILIDFGFSTLGLNRINAVHFGDNPASGRVMEKLGMVKEGYRRRQTPKWGVYRDVALYGLLREDWENTRASAGP